MTRPNLSPTRHRTGLNLLSKSRGEARRLLQQGGVYVNNVRETDPERRISTGDLAGRKAVLLRAGKKSYHLVRVTP